MKKSTKHYLLFVTLLLAFCFSTVAHASVYDFSGKTPVLTLYPDKAANLQYIAYSDKPIYSVKSSNPTVVKAGKENDYFTAKALKTGTATISFKSGGKTFSYKCTVKKYVNPISSVKVGTKVISGTKFNNSAYLFLKYASYRGKKLPFKFVLKSGWTLEDSLYGYYRSTWTKAESRKNGASVTVTGGKPFMVYADCKNTKTGQIISTTLQFN